MPKSKRSKKVSLTQTRRKGLELKQKTIEQVREAVDQYARIFTFSVHNMRNSKLKDVRAEWKHSRVFFGKNKMISLALGRTDDTEYKPNLRHLSRALVGQMGLLFTNTSKDEVVAWFEKFHEEDYARSGNTACSTIVVDQGPIPDFSHAMEPQLRQLGLPTALERGVINLKTDYTICKAGDVLTPEQARLLKLFGHKMADFRITLTSVWSNDGTFEPLDSTIQDSLPHNDSISIKPKVARTDTAEGDEDEEEAMSDEGEEESS